MYGSVVQPVAGKAQQKEGELCIYREEVEMLLLSLLLPPILLIHSRTLAHGMVLPKAWYCPSLIKGATLLG